MLKKFTKAEIETALKVLTGSRYAKNWARRMAEFHGVDLETPEGQAFFEKHCREAARKLLK